MRRLGMGLFRSQDKLGCDGRVETLVFCKRSVVLPHIKWPKGQETHVRI